MQPYEMIGYKRIIDNNHSRYDDLFCSTSRLYFVFDYFDFTTTRADVSAHCVLHIHVRKTTPENIPSVLASALLVVVIFSRFLRELPPGRAGEGSEGLRKMRQQYSRPLDLHWIAQTCKMLLPLILDLLLIVYSRSELTVQSISLYTLELLTLTTPTNGIHLSSLSHRSIKHCPPSFKL